MLNAALVQVTGYITWTLVMLWVGIRLNAGEKPHGAEKWFTVVGVLTLMYFLLQVGFLHAKLNRIQQKLDGKEIEG